MSHVVTIVTEVRDAEADLQMKQRALDRIDEPVLTNGRRRKTDELLDFLDSL